MNLRRRVLFVSVVLLAGLGASFVFTVRGAADSVEIAVPENGRLARSAEIIRNSTPSKPGVLRVLFYGQSISSRKWTEPAMRAIEARFPDTRFVVLNMAIGGFDTQRLERTVDRDIMEAYPDLVVFHAYGDHRAYEAVIRAIRARTAAEVIIQTDHVAEPVEPQCEVGLRTTISVPPGCKGILWLKQNSWEEHMSGKVLPALAQRYALALDPRRKPWKAYLYRHHLPPAALLADGIHPNEAGWRMMAALFDGYFQQQVAGFHGASNGLVTTLRPSPGDGPKTYRVDGNRIEIIADGPLDGHVDARIDGRASGTFDGCWQTSRTTTLPGVSDWPALRQVTVDPTFHRAESWLMTVTNLSQRQDAFRFSVSSAAMGPDGSGSAGEDFISPSGRIRIATKDWVIPEGLALKDKKVPEGFQIRWSTRFVCGDQPPIRIDANRVEVRHVVATGLPNGPHDLTLTLAADTRSLIREIRVYRPPLHQ